MAMDIITKEKKNIMWRGLPTNTEQEGARLQVGARIQSGVKHSYGSTSSLFAVCQMDLSSRKERIEKKTHHLQATMLI
jgi:hypothetical protein